MDANEVDNVTKVPVEKAKKRKRFTVNQALEIAILFYVTILFYKVSEIEELIIHLIEKG
jgi:hypothetical protein